MLKLSVMFCDNDFIYLNLAYVYYDQKINGSFSVDF